MTEQMEDIAVIGAGYMGGGIAQALASPGSTCLADAYPERPPATRSLAREAEQFEARVCSRPAGPSWSGAPARRGYSSRRWPRWTSSRRPSSSGPA